MRAPFAALAALLLAGIVPTASAAPASLTIAVEPTATGINVSYTATAEGANITVDVYVGARPGFTFAEATNTTRVSFLSAEGGPSTTQGNVGFSLASDALAYVRATLTVDGVLAATSNEDSASACGDACDETPAFEDGPTITEWLHRFNVSWTSYGPGVARYEVFATQNGSIGARDHALVATTAPEQLSASVMLERSGFVSAYVRAILTNGTQKVSATADELIIAQYAMIEPTWTTDCTGTTLAWDHPESDIVERFQVDAYNATTKAYDTLGNVTGGPPYRFDLPRDARATYRIQTFYEGSTFNDSSRVFPPFDLRSGPSAAFTLNGRPSHEFGALSTVVGAPVAAIANVTNETRSFAWTWGDGTNGTGARTSHVYERPGRFAVLLRVTDCFGASGSATARVDVAAAPATPSAPASPSARATPPADESAPTAAPSPMAEEGGTRVVVPLAWLAAPLALMLAGALSRRARAR